MEKIWQGMHHEVFDMGDGLVLKKQTPENPISWNNARKSLQFFWDNFRDFIPNYTEIKLWTHSTYEVLQSKIEWITLWEYLQNGDIHIWVINALTIFIRRAIRIAERNKAVFDIIWEPYNNNYARSSIFSTTNFLVQEHNKQQPICFVDVIGSSRCIQAREIESILTYYISEKRRKYVARTMEKYKWILWEITNISAKLTAWKVTTSDRLLPI